MRYFGIWHGGGSCIGGGREHVEVFESLRAAKRALSDRYERGYSFPQTFDYAHRPPERLFTPCADDSSEIWLYSEDDTGESYPDLIVKFGPRGGVVAERSPREFWSTVHFAIRAIEQLER